MVRYQFTRYFEIEVLRKRPYIKKDWCIRFWSIRYELKSRSITAIVFGLPSRSLREDSCASSHSKTN